MKNHIALSDIKLNPDNPRTITDAEFNNLKKSLKKDPAIMTVRPLVLNGKNDLLLLAGEQRYKALVELGYTEISNKWILFADQLTDEQKKKFIILDNHHSGTWDISKLTSSWNIEELTQWDITIPGLDLNIPEILPVTQLSDTKPKQPLATDNDYSVFELVMLHENKVKLLEVLNKVKSDNGFEKLEEALMHIVNNFS